MRSRENLEGIRFQGGNTHTHRVGAGGRSGQPVYIYVIYIYVIYILLYIQGGKHAASACKGGTYPQKDSERVVRGSASG